MSTKPMTDADLAAIEARAKAATPGPWASTWAHTEHDGVPAEQLDEAAIVSTAEGRAGDDAVVVGSLWHDGPHTVCREHDAAFIATARTDVPALVAEVRRLRSERDALRAALVRVHGIADRLHGDSDHAGSCTVRAAGVCRCKWRTTEAELFAPDLLDLLGAR